MIGGRWSGTAEATHALVQIATECARDEVVGAAMLKVSRPIAEEMGAALYQRVTRRSGETGEAIEAQQVDKDQTPGVVVVEIGPRRRTAGFKVRFWEFGTSRLPARPFMRPIWDEHESTFSTAVTAALGKAYATVAGRFRARAARAV
jgi:HK97 gp10 family phage protein